MPRARKFAGLKRPKPINLILPGLGRGVGRDRDRFRVSSGTYTPDVYEARIVMIRHFAEHGHFDVLHGILDGRFTMAELAASHRKGKEAVRALMSEHSGKLVAPLLRSYAKHYKKRDRTKTLRRVERFIEAVGARGESVPESAAAKAARDIRKSWRERMTTSELTAEHVNAFLADLKAMNRGKEMGDASGGTRNRYRGAISGFATWLVRNKHIETHPIAFKAVEKYEEDDHRMPDMSAAEYARYFERVYAERADLAIILKLLIHTGPDLGELLLTTVRDYRLQDAPRVRYRRTKTRTPERFVPMPLALATELQGHVAAHGIQGTDLMFGMFVRVDVESQHERARSAIGRNDLRIKDLRHIAAIQWRRAGADLQTVQVRLGHATINQTTVYTAFSPDESEDSESAEAAAALLTGETGIPNIQRKRAIAT